MALDDSVKARSINVTTRGSTVTLSGIVESKAEHDRAMALARETEGVTQVIDDLKMLQRVG
jgi:osmotically-inducible protein OsmY